MTRMENLQPDLDEQTRQDAVYERAMLSMKRSEARRVAQGHAVMSAFMGYGAGALGGGIFEKVSKAGQLFCITFACVVPPLLVWTYLL